jgi:predicted GNAT superfamily acetyltransferase
MKIEIRAPRTVEEFRDLERLQQEVWQIPTGFEPAETLVTIHKSGGVVLAAYDPAADGLVVGIAFGFLGRTADGQLKHTSHMLGVLDSYRDRGLGTELKLAQREAVLAQGLELMTWTFDPLESRNARLNLGKLGTVAKTYFPNHYGDMGGVNEGLSSDRFQVDWFLASRRVKRRLEGEQSLRLADLRDRGVTLLNSPKPDHALRPPDDPVTFDRPELLVQIPSDFQKLKIDDIALAKDWREHTQSLFTTAFDLGYTATEFLFELGESYYLLEKDWSVE